MLGWLKGLGWIIGPLIGWFLFRWLPDHPEYGEKFLYYLIKLIPFTFSWKKRKTIGTEIHGYITEEIKNINTEAFNFKILPKGIKIEWVLKKTPEITIEENEIVIRLGLRVNPCENFVDALILYLSNSFMRNERIYLDPALYEACKFHIAISMLRKRSDKHYQVFIEKYYKPALEKYKEVLNYSEKLESVEKNGLFISIFLPVILFYVDKWVSQRKAPSAEIQQEIINLFVFIHNISTKKEYEEATGQEPPLTYPGKHIRIGVVLVARRELAEQFDYRPHFEIGREKLKSEVDILFVTGRGRNVNLAEAVSLKLKRERFCEQINGTCKFNFYSDEGRKIEGVCYAFKRKV